MTVLLEDIVQSVELWLKLLRKKPQPFVDPDLDPVILVPGIAGSILKAVDCENGSNGERVWVRIFEADYKFRTKLWSKFDKDTGRSVTLDPKTRIVVPEDRHGLHAIDVLDPDLMIGRECVYYFHDMIFEMIEWGFQEGKTLFGFGYDFRQSNRLNETMERFSRKLQLAYEASGGRKINVVSHSMGGLLVKCFMSLHSDVFEKYVKNWIAIAAPFRGKSTWLYIMSTVLNGMSFVEGWEQNFFISKWSMHQLLVECPSVYELMACPFYHWQHVPLLEIWREKPNDDGNSKIFLDSYPPEESIKVFEDALSNNSMSSELGLFGIHISEVNYDGENIPLPFNLEILKWAIETKHILARAKVPPSVKFYNIYGTNLETPHSVCYGSDDAPVVNLQELRFLEPRYVCVDGDGTVPAESAKADGLNAEARVGVPAEHRGILCDHHVFRILKHWLKADKDPYYNPLNDYVILPTAFEKETHNTKNLQFTSLKEEWEIISHDQDENTEMVDQKPLVSSIRVSQQGTDQSSQAEACATLVVHPRNEGEQHVELNVLECVH